MVLLFKRLYKRDTQDFPLKIFKDTILVAPIFWALPSYHSNVGRGLKNAEIKRGQVLVQELILRFYLSKGGEMLVRPQLSIHRSRRGLDFRPFRGVLALIWAIAGLFLGFRPGFGQFRACFWGFLHGFRPIQACIWRFLPGFGPFWRVSAWIWALFGLFLGVLG